MRLSNQIDTMQFLALKNPCRLAVEVSSPTFTHDFGDRVVRLTVNTGWE